MAAVAANSFQHRNHRPAKDHHHVCRDCGHRRSRDRGPRSFHLCGGFRAESLAVGRYSRWRGALHRERTRLRGGVVQRLEADVCVAVVSSATSQVAGRAKRISQTRAGKLAPVSIRPRTRPNGLARGRQWKSDSGRHRVLPSCHAPASLRGICFSFHDRQRASAPLLRWIAKVVLSNNT